MGECDRLITIEACVDTVGPSSFPIETWAPLPPAMWAAMDDRTGGEAYAADQVSGVADVIWQVAYRSDCDPELLDVVKLRRIVFNARVYDIVAARQIDRRRALELLTRVKVG